MNDDLFPSRSHCRFCQAWSALSTDAPALPERRLFGRALLAAGAATALPAAAQGVAKDVGSTSMFTKLVSAEQIEAAAAKQYAQMLAEARSKGSLGPDEHPQVKRLRAISQRIVPHARPWNPRAAQWRWEVNLLGSKQLNAFCMPGGKIAFFSGILQQLQLEDAEVAAIMGHEAAHALREHARERVGKSSATSIGLSLGAQLLGLGSLGDAAANLGTQLLTLKFSRDDETEADLVGMELAARAGYDPAAGVSLWEKMQQASKGAPPQWMSTHPSSSSRIAEIREKLPKVQPLYARSDKPRERYAPMPRSGG
ncbi:MAG TPA: M48 family metallopeptidase [Methylibium sp.]|nr:M48 family metallopeptidase [Methylibium sp.]